MAPSGLITGEGLSELENASVSFAKAYELQVKVCDKHSVKMCQIFNSTDTRSIFFNLLADCFLKLNLASLAEKAKAWGALTKVSFEDISKELYILSQSQLQTLKILHHDLIALHPEAKIPEAYRPLALFFERTDLRREERLSAVRFIMDIASLANEIDNLKNTFAQYQPKTLGEMEHIHQQLEQLDTDWSLHGLLIRVLDSIQNVNGALRKWSRPLWEVGSWMRRLLRYRRTFSKKIVEVSALGLAEAQNSAYRLIVALESIFHWEKICIEDENHSTILADDRFSQTLGALKSSIHSRLTRFEKLLEVLRTVSSEALEGISVYYLLLLSRHDKLYQDSLQSPLSIDPTLRQIFKRLSTTILALKVKLSHVVYRDCEAMSLYPKAVQEQLKYFQYQVPEVLLRGNRNELQKLTKVVRHSYNNIGHQWAKAVPKDIQEVRGKLTLTVTHATAMMRRFQRAGM